MNLLPFEVLFVGDSLIDDVYGPQQLEIKTVLINRKDKCINETGIRPDFVVNSLVKIWDIVSLEME